MPVPTGPKILLTTVLVVRNSEIETDAGLSWPVKARLWVSVCPPATANEPTVTVLELVRPLTGPALS